jgi:hypothetical protein
MEKKHSMFLVCLGYGVIIALALIVYNLIIFLLNMDQNKALQFLSYAILIGGILLSQFNFRNRYRDGFIDYGNAFLVGFLVSIVLTVIMGIYTYVFFNYIDPGAMEEVMSKAEQSMMDKGMTDLEIEQGMAMMAKVNSPGWFTLFAILSNLIGGTIISLITAIFVKKENAGFDQPTY